MKKILFILVFILIGINVFAFNVVSGESKADIVLSKDASEAEKYAASELVKYVNKATGVTLNITTEPTQNNIFIGVDSTISKENDGISLKVENGNLYLFGCNQRCSIYAVYEFLEKYMGVRFFTIDRELVPQTDKISCPDDLKYSFTSPLYYRETDHKTCTWNSYCVKCRFNGEYTPAAPQYGGKIAFIAYFCHSFQYLLPVSEYGESHPEYFAMVKGHRKIEEGAQPCLSNPEVRKIIAENTIKAIEKNKSKNKYGKIISVSQNDNRDVCECEKCQALNKKYGEHSGLLLELVNYVADEVAKVYPDMYVETLAYHQTRLAPKGIKPRPNVIIRLCTIENNQAEPYELRDKYAPYQITNSTYLKYIGVDPHSVNTQFDENITKWSKLTDKLYIWDYVVNFQAYHNLLPNFQCIQPNIRYFIKKHAIAVFEEGDRDNQCCCFDELRSYIISKELWDYNTPVAPLIKEFCDYVYGEGSDEVQEVIKTFTDVVTKNHFYFCCNTLDMEWMSNEDYIKCIKLLQKALEETKDTPAYEKVYMCYLDWLYGNYKKSDKDFEMITTVCNLPWNTKGEYYNHLREYSEAHNVPNIAEHKPFDKSKLAKDYGKAGVKIDQVKDLPEEDWFEVSAEQLKPSGDYGTYLENDPTSSNGKVAVYQRNQEWGSYMEVMGNVAKAQKDGYKTFDFYLVVKSRGKKNDIGNAISFGVYDNGLKQHTFHGTVKLSEINDDTWSVVPLGSWNITEAIEPTFFHVGEKNEFNVKEYIVDKVVVVMKK